MNKNTSDKSVDEYIDTFKAEALEKLTGYMSVLIIIAMPISIYRTVRFGWLDIYYVEYALFMLLALVYIFRRRSSYRSIIYTYLMIGFATSIVEYYHFGLMGAGEVASMFSLMLSLFYLDRRHTYVVFATVTILFIFGAYVTTYSGITPRVDQETYGHSLVPWIVAYQAGMLFFFLIGLSVSHLQQQTIRMVVELKQKNAVIEQQKQEIEYLANHDPLTGLPTLRVAEHRLEDVLKFAAEKQHQSALLFLDLDGFKAINDSYGHEAGDAVLKTTAERISSSMRSADIACRVGGDEFLVIVEKISNETEISNLCKRLVSAISEPVSFNNTQLQVSVSIGAATYPTSADDAKSLRAKADQLMYKVKQDGKNNYMIAIANPVSIAY